MNNLPENKLVILLLSIVNFKVRIRELVKYRDHGLSKQSELVPFERQRFRRLNRNRLRKVSKLKSVSNSGSGTNTPTMANNLAATFLPKSGDYSIKALTDIDYESKERDVSKSMKKRPKKSKWNRKKMKTGRRLLLKHGCILTIADKALKKDSTDQDEDTS